MTHYTRGLLAELLNAGGALGFRMQQELNAQAGVKSIESAVDDYRSQLADLVQELLRGGHRLSKVDFRRQHKALIKSSGKDTFGEGWAEGEGDPDDMTPDDLQLLFDFVSEQQGHVNDFSDWLTDKASDLEEVPDRLDVWAMSMTNLGQQAKARAMGDPQLTFDGKDGDESCDECQEYVGETHRLSWWEKRGLTKRNGNDNFTCGRWQHCHHHFYHAKTGDLVID